MSEKEFEKTLRELGARVYDVKPAWGNHNYHKYFIFPNNLYALSVVQGEGMYETKGTYEVALGVVTSATNYESFDLIYKEPLDDVLGHQTPKQIVELAKQVKRFRKRKKWGRVIKW
jgi:hypothetical protein